MTHAGEAAALGTAVCWAFSATFFTGAARRIGADALNRLRLLLATALLLATMLAMGGGWGIPPRQLALMVVSGIVGLVLGDAAYFRSLVILGPRRATLMMALSPAVTALLMVPLLGETIGAVGIAGMAITLAGVAWVQADREGHDEAHGSLARGVLLGLGGVLGQAGGFVLAKAALGAAPAGSGLASLAGLPGRETAAGPALAGEAVSPLFGTLLRMTAASVALLGLSAVRGELGALRAATRDRTALLATVAGTVTGPFLGVWLSLEAVSRTNTAVASTIMACFPIFVIPIVCVAHRERVSARAFAGALVALAGVAVLSFRVAIAEWAHA